MVRKIAPSSSTALILRASGHRQRADHTPSTTTRRARRGPLTPSTAPPSPSRCSTRGAVRPREGAFTGGVARKTGLFEEASSARCSRRGRDLGIAMQAKILRALQGRRRSGRLGTDSLCPRGCGSSGDEPELAPHDVRKKSGRSLLPPQRAEPSCAGVRERTTDIPAGWWTISSSDMPAAWEENFRDDDQAAGGPAAVSLARKRAAARVGGSIRSAVFLAEGRRSSSRTCRRRCAEAASPAASGIENPGTPDCPSRPFERELLQQALRKGHSISAAGRA